MSFRISFCCKLQVERNFAQYKCSQHTRTHIFDSQANCCIPTGTPTHLSHSEMHVLYIAGWGYRRHWLGTRLYRRIYWITHYVVCLLYIVVVLFAVSLSSATIISSFSHIKVETKIECGVDLMEI